MPKTTKTEAPAGFHFYASTIMNWGVGNTRAEAIAKVLRDSKGSFRADDNGGVYVFTVRVDAPKESSYEIREYVPHGVPISDKLEGSFKMIGKSVVLCSRVTD